MKAYCWRNKYETQVNRFPLLSTIQAWHILSCWNTRIQRKVFARILFRASVCLPTHVAYWGTQIAVSTLLVRRHSRTLLHLSNPLTYITTGIIHSYARHTRFDYEQRSHCCQTSYTNSIPILTLQLIFSLLRYIHRNTLKQLQWAYVVYGTAFCQYFAQTLQEPKTTHNVITKKAV
jgi:hypothetical protein